MKIVWKPQYTFIALVAIVIIGVIILIKVMFSGKGTTNDDLVKQLIAAKDSVIERYKDNIAVHERLIEEKDKGLIALHERDSILNVHYSEAELTYKKLNETIRNIPIRINRISGNADSLRAAFREF